jgi:hypothetical protein
MRRTIAHLVPAALIAAAAGALGASDVAACESVAPTIAAPNARREQVVFDWNDGFESRSVRFRSRTCADLNGTLFTPEGMAGDAVLPAVLVLPPSGGVADESQVMYLARYLATNGYLALTVDPQGLGDSGLLSDPACGTAPGYSNPSPCPGVPFQSMDNWMELGRSALDFLLSLPNVDDAHIGAVGHSLGARASSYLQDPFFDAAPGGAQRVHAVVGLDNISSNYFGDSSAGGGNSAANDAVVGQPVPGDHPIAINAPALGLASDGTNADTDFKKYAFTRWRDARVPSGMLVFDGIAHGDFSQQASSDEAMLRRYAHYTLAWFDRWLRSDLSATARLLGPPLAGDDLGALLSGTQRSAWYLPLEYESDDWRAALLAG